MAMLLRLTLPARRLSLLAVRSVVLASVLLQEEQGRKKKGRGEGER